MIEFCNSGSILVILFHLHFPICTKFLVVEIYGRVQRKMYVFVFNIVSFPSKNDQMLCAIVCNQSMGGENYNNQSLRGIRDVAVQNNPHNIPESYANQWGGVKWASAVREIPKTVKCWILAYVGRILRGDSYRTLHLTIKCKTGGRSVTGRKQALRFEPVTNKHSE